MQVRAAGRIEAAASCTRGRNALVELSHGEDSSQLVHCDAELRVVRAEALFGLDAEALAALMVEAGEPAWRGRQLAEALYRQRIAELDEITTLPKALRQRLAAEGWKVGRPRIAQVFRSVDGTERYLVECQDEQTVETVWMPEGDGGESGDGTKRTIRTRSRKTGKGSTGSAPRSASPARWAARSTASSA